MTEIVVQIGFPRSVIDALLDDDPERRATMLVRCHVVFAKAVHEAIEPYREDEE